MRSAVADMFNPSKMTGIVRINNGNRNTPRTSRPARRDIRNHTHHHPHLRIIQDRTRPQATQRTVPPNYQPQRPPHVLVAGGDCGGESDWMGGEMINDTKKEIIPKFAFIDEYMRRTYVLPKNWQATRLSVSPQKSRNFPAVPSGQIYVYGAVYTEPEVSKKTIVRGTLFERFIESSALDEFKKNWEIETGRCSECEGTGKKIASSSINNGTTYRDCKICGGSGENQ